MFIPDTGTKNSKNHRKLLTQKLSYQKYGFGILDPGSGKTYSVSRVKMHRISEKIKKMLNYRGMTPTVG